MTFSILIDRVRDRAIRQHDRVEVPQVISCRTNQATRAPTHDPAIQLKDLPHDPDSDLATVQAQCDPTSVTCNQVGADGKGILAGGILGAEIGFLIPAIIIHAGARELDEWWSWILFPVLGAVWPRRALDGSSPGRTRPAPRD